MQPTATHTTEYTEPQPVLYLAFELGERTWKLGFTTGHGQKPRERNIAARDLERLAHEIAQAKQRFRLATTTPVVSCYEAGRDGFWLHRFLQAQGIANCIVDSSAIEVNRRQRRAKSDALDVRKLVTMLIRYQHGERKLWSVVRVPSVAEEDQRQLHREIHTLKQERTRTSNRIKGLLSAQGLRLPQLKHLPVQLASVRLWDGSPVPASLWRRLERDYAHYLFLVKQLREVEAERRALVRTSSATSIAKVRQLMQLRGIGINGAWVCVMEFFGWRQFANRREVAASAGLTPTPFQSGGRAREQGISKAGNRHVRWLMIELAWCWVRYQPESALTRWYLERFYDGGSRARRIGLVAVARKLLIALWRFLETGELPEGATLKSECPRCPSESLGEPALGAGESRELPSDAGVPSGSPAPSRS